MLCLTDLVIVLSRRRWRTSPALGAMRIKADQITDPVAASERSDERAYHVV